MADRPIDHAQQLLISAILRGDYPPGTALPGERTLADRLGVTRATLREVLRRLESGGWLSIQHGKSTIVTDYLREGGLNVLSDMVRYGDDLSLSLVPDMLRVRLDLAPSYTRLALEHNPVAVRDLLAPHADLDDTAAAYARFDWRLHIELSALSKNPIYTMILNGFTAYYIALAERFYFQPAESRRSSADFYAGLYSCALNNDPHSAETLTRRVMAHSIRVWQDIYGDEIP
jgi:GntR family transcriptional regulator, negative regulator for fad regulon and positive regulator of fabA